MVKHLVATRHQVNAQNAFSINYKIPANLPTDDYSSLTVHSRSCTYQNTEPISVSKMIPEDIIITVA